MKKKIPWWLTVLLVGVLAFALIQLIPYGKAHTNPPVINSPQWADATTKDMVTRACYDCHSNETHWPWYTNIAPASWLVQRDVDEGRRRLNFSEWPTSLVAQQGLMQEAVGQLQEGEMPPFQYLLIHTDVKFTQSQNQQLANGMLNSVPK
jgi:hypothetical protein